MAISLGAAALSFAGGVAEGINTKVDQEQKSRLRRQERVQEMKDQQKVRIDESKHMAEVGNWEEEQKHVKALRSMGDEGARQRYIVEKIQGRDWESFMSQVANGKEMKAVSWTPTMASRPVFQGTDFDSLAKTEGIIRKIAGVGPRQEDVSVTRTEEEAKEKAAQIETFGGGEVDWKLLVGRKTQLINNQLFDVTDPTNIFLLKDARTAPVEKAPVAIGTYTGKEEGAKPVKLFRKENGAIITADNKTVSLDDFDLQTRDARFKTTTINGVEYWAEGPNEGKRLAPEVKIPPKLNASKIDLDTGLVTLSETDPVSGERSARQIPIVGFEKGGEILESRYDAKRGGFAILATTAEGETESNFVKTEGIEPDESDNFRIMTATATDPTTGEIRKEFIVGKIEEGKFIETDIVAREVGTRTSQKGAPAATKAQAEVAQLKMLNMTGNLGQFFKDLPGAEADITALEIANIESALTIDPLWAKRNANERFSEAVKRWREDAEARDLRARIKERRSETNQTQAPLPQTTGR